MAEITGTEIVAPDIRRIQLGARKFKVPPSPTLKYMFWMRRFVKRFQDGNITDDDIVDCYDQTVEFLRRYNTEVDEDELQASCELTDLILFYAHAFSNAPDEEEADAVPPPRTRGTATRSGRNQRAKRSVSST